MRRLVMVVCMLPGCATIKPRISLADFAGTWDVEARVQGSDVVATRYVLSVDATGWTIQFPGGIPALHPRVLSVEGDSIVTRTGPYASTLRQGVFVVTDGVFRLSDGRMIGHSIAHYDVSTPDSVRKIDTIGTRR